MARSRIINILGFDPELMAYKVWTHRANTLEHHKELVPQEIEKIGWEDNEDDSIPEGMGFNPDDKTTEFFLNVSGVPEDHTHFTLRVEGEPLITDVLYGVGPRRFYRLQVNSASFKGEFEQQGGPTIGPGAHYG